MSSSQLFTKALSASAVMLLSAGAATSAVAADIQPEHLTAATAATPASDADDYSLVYLDPYQEDESTTTWFMNAAFSYDWEGGAEYGVLPGTTFELISANPELHASIDESTGKMTINVPERLDMNIKYSFKVLVKMPDGSSKTQDIPFDPARIYPDALSNQINPEYTQYYWDADKSKTEETVTLKDSSFLSSVKHIAIENLSEQSGVLVSVDAQTGAVTFANNNTDSAKDIVANARVTFTYNDGSTDQRSFMVTWNAEQKLAEKYAPSYPQGIQQLQNGSAVTYFDVQNPASAEYLSGYRVLSVTEEFYAYVDAKSGRLQVGVNQPDGTADLQGEAVVEVQYVDGSTDTIPVHFVWKGQTYQSLQYEITYAGESANPVVINKVYEAQPQFVDIATGKVLSELPAGASATLLSSDPALNATVDSATGKVQIHFVELPAETMTYQFVVRFTFADGTVKDVESAYVVNINSQTPTDDVTSSPTAPVAPETSAPADQTESVTTEASTPGAESLVVTENNTYVSSPQLTESGISYSVNSTSGYVAHQPATLANTGAKNALVIFCAGLVALGAGSAIVLRRKH